MQNEREIVGKISHLHTSQHIICETNRICVDVEGSESLETKENIEIVLQEKEIQIKGLVNDKQEGECTSPVSLQQVIDNQLSAQTESPAPNNKNQQLSMYG